MGLGNLSRRVGMNQSTREDRKTLGEAQAEQTEGSSPLERGESDGELIEASKRPEKRERKEGAVTDLTEEIADLVSDFADVEAQLKVLNDRRAALKARATKLSLEHGVDDFSGPEGKVQVIVAKPRVTFDKKKAKQYMTEAQFKSCHKTGKTPDPTVKFVPAEK